MNIFGPLDLLKLDFDHDHSQGHDHGHGTKWIKIIDKKIYYKYNI